MKRFKCQCCDSEVFFENVSCMTCNRVLGYHPIDNKMVALDAMAVDWAAPGDQAPVRLCRNSDLDACNWIVTDCGRDDNHFCLACRHNIMVPDLNSAANVTHWQKIELAKRHLFYSLLRWSLPIPDRSIDSEAALGFMFLADTIDTSGNAQKVTTGHERGLITLNVAEADDAVRERVRNEMREPYRTLVGHFRHEVGHFYWDLLIKNSNQLEEFRALFGAENADYKAALQKYYAEGPVANWRDAFISEYASSHPWEDFAETWAHYTHLVDSLQTARAYGLMLHELGASESDATSVAFEPYRAASIDAIVDAWMPLSIALNSINRSMGQKDFYPFVINEPAIRKLAFVQSVIRNAKSN